MAKQFHLTQDHIDLLEHARVRWSSVEYGAPAIDDKRPFGNSGRSVIEREICQILGYEPVAQEMGREVYDEDEKQEAIETYNELDTAMRIVLRCQTFRPGLFETSDDYGSDWERVKVEHDDDCPVCGERVSLATQGMFGEYTCPECDALFVI